MNRRKFLGSLGASIALPKILQAKEKPGLQRGFSFSAFDRAMAAFMSERGVPGGSLAVSKNGKLVYARGYGAADVELQKPVKPDSLFRIASISKPFTSAAIFRLIEQGKLKLEDRAFDYIQAEPIVAKNRQPDPRLREITIAQLLHHTGGWDRNKSFDPMFRCRIIANAAGVEEPPDQKAIIRYMLGQPLDFAPGTRHAYSNFGYCVLGRIIETVSGLSYEEFVRREVLAPCGVNRMRLGASLNGSEEEVRYYRPGNGKSVSVFPLEKGKVPWPYGGFNLEAMDSHGGWIASAIDLLRFAVALDENAVRPLFPRAIASQIYTAPAPPVARDADGKLAASFYGCGWMVRPQVNGKANYWHNGSLPGTSSLLVRRSDGLAWAVLFNQRSEGSLSDGAIDPALHAAANSIVEWPDRDLFPDFI